MTWRIRDGTAGIRETGIRCGTVGFTADATSLGRLHFPSGEIISRVFLLACRK